MGMRRNWVKMLVVREWHFTEFGYMALNGGFAGMALRVAFLKWHEGAIWGNVLNERVCAATGSKRRLRGNGVLLDFATGTERGGVRWNGT